MSANGVAETPAKAIGFQRDTIVIQYRNLFVNDGIRTKTPDNLVYTCIDDIMINYKCTSTIVPTNIITICYAQTYDPHLLYLGLGLEVWGKLSSSKM
jgi:hypothetical protein